MVHKKCPPSCSLWNSVMPCGLQRAPRAFQSLKGLKLKVLSEHGMSIEHHRIRLRGAFYGFMTISVPEKVICRLRTIVRVKVVLNRIRRSWSTYLWNGSWVQPLTESVFVQINCMINYIKYMINCAKLRIMRKVVFDCNICVKGSIG